MSQPEHPWVLLISVNRNRSQAWPGKFMLQGDVDSFEKIAKAKTTSTGGSEGEGIDKGKHRRRIGRVRTRGLGTKYRNRRCLITLATLCLNSCQKIRSI